MSFTIVQCQASYQGSSVSITPTAGNALWLVGMNGSASVTLSWSSLNGNSIQTIGSQTVSGTYTLLQAQCQSVMSGTDTITLNTTGGQNEIALIIEIQGLSLGKPGNFSYGSGTNSSGVNTGPSLGTVGTVPALALATTFDASAGNTISGPGSGFSSIPITWQGITPPGGKVIAEYQQVNIPGVVTPTCTVSANFDTLFYEAAVFQFPAPQANHFASPSTNCPF